MALKFGTSGVRGLVSEMSDRECYLYARAFLRHVKNICPACRAAALAGDLRSSTERIMRAVALAVAHEQLGLHYCGFAPTPTLALAAMQRQQPGIMVTGSHIPDDRNGMKFYLPQGEILKPDEAAISAGRLTLEGESVEATFSPDGSLDHGQAPDLGAPDSGAAASYLQRYRGFFPANCLHGMRLVLYQHSAVSRDLLADLLADLGAEVTAVARSDVFVPVDTEAVDNLPQLAAWIRQHNADALVSTDGDGDRPLVVDDSGEMVRGDVLGILVSRYLGADAVAAPVSCNAALELCGSFAHVARTRIGSPYVIAAMQEAVAAGGRRLVVGYEANGGYLTASEALAPDTGASLPPLPTRDAALPILALLHAAQRQHCPVSQLVRDLPPRFTSSGLLREFPQEIGQQIVARVEADGAGFVNRFFAAAFGNVESLDFTDGARMTFADGLVVHLRPSGNAPEFRCYTEAETEERAGAANVQALEIVAEQLRANLEAGP